MASKASSVENPFVKYVSLLREHIASNEASEHTYRGALETYIASFGSNIKVTNEPSRQRVNGKGRKLNKVDYTIRRGANPIGYIEAKDVNEDLNAVESGEQIARYCEEFQNLILTDYVEFRRYVKGELRAPIRIGTVKNGKLLLSKHAAEELHSFFEEFLLEDTFTVTTASELANRLATHTKQIRKLVETELNVEEDSKSLHLLMKAFKDVLVSDLNPKKFSDMFAQTLSYGLFAARVHHDGKSEFSRLTAGNILPPTNKFLRKLFTAFVNDHLPAKIASVADEVIDLLKKADIKSILSEFGEQGKSDPIVFFYEAFLNAYDPKLRKEMGVYYTPDPVVDYMVRAIDEILESKFNRKKGIADDKTLILDPALGTGSYLRKIVDHIHKKVPAGKWDSYVSENLLNRIFGFEILMAPYAVAHLKLGLQLQETGYQFNTDERLGVYLTNTLEETAKKSEVLFGDWISEEANAAARVKRDLPIMVVIGNPPYAVTNQNKGEWITQLLKGHDSLNNVESANYFKCDGKPLGSKQVRSLLDDYVKFIRFAHWRVEQSGSGVVAFITNHGFLDNPTFRGMRESLLRDFDEIFVLDLHGSSKKGEESPTGHKDENVFDITTGVSICFLIRSATKAAGTGLGKIYRADLWGSRQEKFAKLNELSFSETPFKKLSPNAPGYFFIQEDSQLREEYEVGIPVESFFQASSGGVMTFRDKLCVQFSEEEVWNVVKDVKTSGELDIRERYELGDDAQDWTIEGAKKDIAGSGPKREKVAAIAYRPFDRRFTYYTGVNNGFMARPAEKLFRHLVSNKKNIALNVSRQSKSSYWKHCFVSRGLSECALISNKTGEGGSVFPLHLEPKGKGSPQSNIVPEMMTLLPKSFKGDDGEEKLFFYIYAVLNSDTYRSRYCTFLKQGIPRIQVTEDLKLFTSLADLGEELSRLHLLEDDRLEGGRSIFEVKGTDVVEKVQYDQKLKRYHINQSQYFSNVSQAAADFQVGAYTVLEKWLKDRKGAKLSHYEKGQFEQVVEAIERTTAIVSKIDAAIAKAGGWPLVTKDQNQKLAA